MRGTSLARLLFSSSIVVFGLAGVGIPTASAAVQDRILTTVSDSNLAAIPGSISPRVLRATDLGPLPADTPLVGMSLRFTPSAAQQAALDQLLRDLQDPSSPRYRQWLTPPEYAAQFGLSSSDIAKVTAWLTSQGFTVTGVANGGSFITFDGTVAQAQAAFSTSIHSLSVNGQTHFANITNVSVPSIFVGVVGAVTGLHDFRPQPRVHITAKPQFTSSVSGNHFVAPGDIYTIYDVNALFNSSFNGGGIGTGSNCKSYPSGTTCGDIAVTGQVDLYNTGTTASPTYADVMAFRSASGLSTVNLPTTVHEGTDPGPANNCTPGGATSCPSPNLNDLGESSLDVEWSGAMAPSASILFVNGKNIFLNSMTQAIDQNVAPIVTTSYGECEEGWGATELNLFNQLFMQANVQGQTILVAAGDEGATDCDPQSATSAVSGLTVDFPASSPYVTAMGGTMFNGDAAATGSGTTWGATQYWAGTSGSDVISSARSYIPEAAWSDVGYGYFGGGGGGPSAIFAKPAWQLEAGAAGMTTTVSADSARDVPDIALNASDIHDSLLYCAQGSCNSGFRVSSGGNLSVAGGTSFDSQIFGGMLALIEQKIGKRLGNINPTLYALGNNAAYYNTASSSVFHDVTTGGNAMPCLTGTLECSNGGSIGFATGTGYDLATGWGSVDLGNMANAWNLVTPLGLGSFGSNLSATVLTATSSSAAAGATVTLTATVISATTGFTTTPTGTVQFLINNVAVGSPVTLVNGVASGPYLTNCTALGQLSATAAYSGDTNYQGSMGPGLASSGTSVSSDGGYQSNPLIINVTSGTCPNLAVTTSAPVVNNYSTISVASGGTIPAVTITATSQNGLTGTVTFTASVVAVITGDSAGVVPGSSLSSASGTLAAGGTATTSLTLSGITASLHLPNAPGTRDSATMLARQSPAHTPPWTAAGAGISLAFLLLLVIPRRRRLGGLLLVALSVALGVGITGCGGSSQSTPPATSSNPYAGTYQVNVTVTFSGSPSIKPQSIPVIYLIQ